MMKPQRAMFMNNKFLYKRLKVDRLGIFLGNHNEERERGGLDILMNGHSECWDGAGSDGT